MQILSLAKKKLMMLKYANQKMRMKTKKRECNKPLKRYKKRNSKI